MIARRRLIAAGTALLVAKPAWTAPESVRRPFWNRAKPSGLAVLVFGGSSRTAQHFIPQALAAGHRVIAVSRRPEEIKVEHPRLTTARADIYDPSSVAALMTGKEVVVSFLGVPDPDMKGDVPPVDLYSKGAAAIIAGMKRKGNRRLVFTTSMGLTIAPPATKPDGSDPRMAYFWMVREIYNDERRAEALIRAGGLDFTIMRPAFITKEPSRGYTIVRREEPYPVNPIITWPDFAAFAVEQVMSREFVGAAVGIDDGRTFQLTPKGMVY